MMEEKIKLMGCVKKIKNKTANKAEFITCSVSIQLSLFAKVQLSSSGKADKFEIKLRISNVQNGNAGAF